MSRLLARILTFLILANSLVAQSIADRVDEYIKGAMTKEKIPGIALAVIKDGKPLIAKGYGLANVEHQISVKPESIFQSGSVGKQFTSMAVMLLVDEGKIGLDDEIGKYIDDAPEAWKNITIRHLLSHTGGLTDYPEDFDYRKDYTEVDLIDIVRKIPPAFAPGERWSYSNLGYVTLGAIIRKASGKFYGDFLQERVFGTLDMTTARIISEADIVPNRAAGYMLSEGILKNQRWVSPTLNTTADGALYLTLNDMIKWDAALKERKLLSRRAYDAMWTPVKLNDGRATTYGFGWVLKTVNGHSVIEHGGAWQGFKSFISRYPDDGLSVIVFGNARQMNPARIAHSIVEIVEPKLKPEIVDSNGSGDIAAICRAYEKLASGTFDPSAFTTEVAAMMSGPQKDLYKWPSEEGAVKRFFLTHEEKTESGHRYNLRAEHEKLTFFLDVVRNEDGKFSVFDLDLD